MKYRSGQSGNPKGKPKGARDKRTALRALLEPHATELVNTVVARALAGDTTALRICIDRLIPPIKAKDSPISINKLDGSLAEQGKAVLDALATGQITPDEASSVMSAISAQARILEIDELERRVRALEERNGES